jgi:hypothetical protein
MLVHSQRPLRQDHLRRFTNYSQAIRQLSGDAYSVSSVDEADSASKTEAEVGAVPVLILPHNHQPLKATLSDSSQASSLTNQQGDPADHASLQQRRSGSNRLSLDVGRAHFRTRSRSMQHGSQHPSTHSATPAPSDPTVATSGSGGIFSTAHLPTSTQTATQQLAELDLSNQQQLNITKGLPASTPIDPDLTPSSENPRALHIRTSVDAFVIPDPVTAAIPSSAVRDLCSVFVPHFEEYYTVTDNIDVSCFRNLSPPRSPVPVSAASSTSPRLSHRLRAESISTKVSLRYTQIINGMGARERWEGIGSGVQSNLGPLLVLVFCFVLFWEVCVSVCVFFFVFFFVFFCFVFFCLFFFFK